MTQREIQELKNSLGPNEVLVLRTCNADMTSSCGFVWPESGYIEAPDWEPTQECKHGLHGLEKGEKHSYYLNTSEESKWLVVRVDRANGFVDLGGKCKFRCGEVVYCGDRYSAAEILKGVYPEAMVHYSTQVSKNYGVSITGNHGTSIAGDGGQANLEWYGISIAGDYGSSVSEYHGISIAGYGGGSTSEHRGISIAGDRGKAKSKGCGISIALDYGVSTTKHRGISIAGKGGKATSGAYGISISNDDGKAWSRCHGISIVGDSGESNSEEWGISIAGYEGKASAGIGGVLVLRDPYTYEPHVAKVDGKTIKANTLYKLKDGEFVEVEDQHA